MPELSPPNHLTAWVTLTGEDAMARNWTRFIQAIDDLQAAMVRNNMSDQIPLWWWMPAPEQLAIRIQEAYFNHPQGTPRTAGGLMTYIQVVLTNNIHWVRDWGRRQRLGREAPEPETPLENEFFNRRTNEPGPTVEATDRPNLSTPPEEGSPEQIPTSTRSSQTDTTSTQMAPAPRDI